MADKVDWLYKAPTQDREEYLLGRKIDKFVDPTLEEQASYTQVSLGYRISGLVCVVKRFAFAGFQRYLRLNVCVNSKVVLVNFFETYVHPLLYLCHT